MESEYSRDEAEEILARVLSVVDSTEHFITQITNILNEVYNCNVLVSEANSDRLVIQWNLR